MTRNGVKRVHTATTTRENNRARAALNQKPHRFMAGNLTRPESQYPEVSTFKNKGRRFDLAEHLDFLHDAFREVDVLPITLGLAQSHLAWLKAKYHLSTSHRQ